MINAILVLVIMLALIAWIFADPVLKQQKRSRLKKKSFPIFWISIIQRNVPLYNVLSPPQRKRLQEHIQVFLAEKQFIGCQGLQVTEEMKVTIAAWACVLLLNERGNYYPQLRSILVYPSTYIVNETRAVGSHVVEESQVARLGESWTKDQVVLSWEQIQQDAHKPDDGRNVALHEFAHQLDSEDGNSNGVPTLARQSDYLGWAAVMSQEYEQLCEAVRRGAKTVIDAYGATNPAEFFAVATETFFEKPQALFRNHQALYQLLRGYYQLDPVEWDI